MVDEKEYSTWQLSSAKILGIEDPAAAGHIVTQYILWAFTSFSLFMILYYAVVYMRGQLVIQVETAINNSLGPRLVFG